MAGCATLRGPQDSSPSSSATRLSSMTSRSRGFSRSRPSLPEFGPLRWAAPDLATWLGTSPASSRRTGRSRPAACGGAHFGATAEKLAGSRRSRTWPWPRGRCPAPRRRHRPASAAWNGSTSTAAVQRLSASASPAGSPATMAATTSGPPCGNTVVRLGVPVGANAENGPPGRAARGCGCGCGSAVRTCGRRRCGPRRRRRRCAASGRAAEQRRHVVLHRLLGDEQPLADLPVGEALPISSRTLRSCGVSRPAARACRTRPGRAISWLAARGSSSDSPEAAVRTAPTSRSRGPA